MLRDLAAAVRRAQRHDASRFLVRMEMKQRADQDTAQTVAHEMHSVGAELSEKTRQPLRVSVQIGADGGIRIQVYREALASESARQRTQTERR